MLQNLKKSAWNCIIHDYPTDNVAYFNGYRFFKDSKGNLFMISDDNKFINLQNKEQIIFEKIP